MSGLYLAKIAFTVVPFWIQDLIHDSKLRVLIIFANVIFTGEYDMYIYDYPVNISDFIFECILF